MLLAVEALCGIKHDAIASFMSVAGIQHQPPSSLMKTLGLFRPARITARKRFRCRLYLRWR
jgi:hypothetical protein